MSARRISKHVIEFDNPFTGLPIRALDAERLGLLGDGAGSARLPRKPSVARPRFRLLETRTKPRLRGCRLGGRPLVEPGTLWPVGKRGPLAFVGQLDFEELASVERVGDLPDRGILSLFLDDGDARGYVVLYADPDRAAPLEPLEELTATSLQPRFDVMEPDMESAGLATASRDRPDHRVAGHAAWLNGDGRLTEAFAHHGIDVTGLLAMAPEDAEREALKREQDGMDFPAIARERSSWNLLWQIDRSEASGLTEERPHVLVRDDDLKARRFERAWVAREYT